MQSSSINLIGAYMQLGTKLYRVLKPYKINHFYIAEIVRDPTAPQTVNERRVISSGTIALHRVKPPVSAS